MGHYPIFVDFSERLQMNFPCDKTRTVARDIPDVDGICYCILNAFCGRHMSTNSQETRDPLGKRHILFLFLSLPFAFWRWWFSEIYFNLSGFRHFDSVDALANYGRSPFADMYFPRIFKTVA